MRQLLSTISLLVLFFSINMNNQADNMEHPSLSVSASASVEALPDFITLIVEIEKTKPTKAKAKESVDLISGKILSALQQLEINPDNIQASEITVQPKYNWTKNERVFVGEQVRRTIKIKLYQIDKYTEVVSSITKHDINRYHQQGFGYDNIDEYRNKALLLAIEKAKQKAQLIAQAFGKKIGDVRQVIENYQPMPRPLRMLSMNEQKNSAKDTAPLEIKPQEIEASISVIFLLK